MTDVITKLCKACNVEKPLSEFHKGHTYQCKSCRSILRKNSRKTPLPEVKVCKSCGVEKPQSEFSIRTEGYLFSWCKSCVSDYHLVKYREDPEYRQRHNLASSEAHKKKMKDDPEYRKKRNRAIYEYIKERKKVDPEFREKINKRNNSSRYKHQTCSIIKKHHEEMKDDPDHLSTEFIQSLIKVDCKK